LLRWQLRPSDGEEGISEGEEMGEEETERKRMRTWIMKPVKLKFTSAALATPTVTPTILVISDPLTRQTDSEN